MIHFSHIGFEISISFLAIFFLYRSYYLFEKVKCLEDLLKGKKKEDREDAYKDLEHFKSILMKEDNEIKSVKKTLNEVTELESLLKKEDEFQENK